MAVGDITELRNGAWVPIGKPVNPPPPGVVSKYGASWGGASDEAGPNQASFERITATFGGMEVGRYFPGPNSAPLYSSFPSYLRLAGCAIVYDWDLPPAAVAAGTHDAAITAMFQSMPTDREIWHLYQQEVDDDLNAPTPPFTLQEFWDAAVKIKSLQTTALQGRTNVHFCLSLTGDAFIPSRTPPHPYDFYWEPGGSFDAVAMQMHQQGNSFATMETATTLCSGVLQARDNLGAPIVIAELSVRNTQFQTDTQRANTLSQIVGLLDTKASAACYYESFRGTEGPWNITEEPLGTIYSPQAKIVWSQAVSNTSGGPMPYDTTPPPPPPPPPLGGTLIGASQFDFDDYNTLLKNPTGAKTGGINTGLSVRRSYDNAFKSAFGSSAAGGDPGRGVASAYSMQVTGAQVRGLPTDTTMQNQLRSYFNSIPAGHRMWFTLGHEPEDQITHGDYNYADFRVMQAVGFDILVSSSADRNFVKYGPILTNEPYRANSPATPASYYPGGGTLATVNWSKVDFVGVDFYNYWRPPTAPEDPALPSPRGNLHEPTYWADPTFAFARAGNKPICVMEHGIHPDPEVPTMRPTRFQATLDYWESKTTPVECFMLFHSNQGTHGPWWFHCFHVYPQTGTGVAPWNSGNKDDVSHVDNPTINKVRDMLASHPKWQNGD